MNIIMFDERNPYYNIIDDESNRKFIEGVVASIRNTYNIGGYIYLNKIYEDLGAVWNPRNTNLAFINDCDHELWIKFNHGVGGPKWYIYVDYKLKKTGS